MTLHQDAKLYAGLFDGDEAASLAIAPGRLAYAHVARGDVEINGRKLAAGDAIKLDGESALHVAQGRSAEVLVFDLPA